eukprot:11945274-Prorocentrum_lima.AAC.1
MTTATRGAGVVPCGVEERSPFLLEEDPRSIRRMTPCKLHVARQSVEPEASADVAEEPANERGT